MRRQPYQRASSPSPIRLTERDKHILETIHAFDGTLSLKQIDRLFFSGQGRSQPRARMRLLFDNGFVALPSRDKMHQVPLGETIYWLDKQGAAIVAAAQGKLLRQFSWRRQPRYSLIAHDLAVNDFRIAVLQAIEKMDGYELAYWIPESEFAARPDKVEFKSAQGKKRQRSIRPDGFFIIRQHHWTGQTKEFAFLLEMDMGSEDNPRFTREKVLPGMAYLGSEIYQQRFGLRYGRYLVVTTSQRRLHNMKSQTERAGGQGKFYFSLQSEITKSAIFKRPTWHLAGREQPQSILPEAT